MEKLFNLPEDVSIDYVHQVCLGVVKTVLLNFKRALKVEQLERIDSILVKARLPSVIFSRQLRRISALKYWKASELKLFMLYGFVVLWEYLTSDLFCHFYLLSESVRLLCTAETPAVVRVAEKCLYTFSRNVKDFYGEAGQIYNVHAVTHLANQVNFLTCFCILNTDQVHFAVLFWSFQ